MLRRQFRLSKQRDIAALFMNHKQMVRVGGLALRWQKNGLAHSRVTVVVSKKTARLATVRNRLRRLVREGLRQIWPQIPMGYDMMLVVALPATITQAQVHSLVQSLFNRWRV